MPADRPYFHRAEPARVLLVDRLLTAPPETVWSAFESAAALARWWGPAGFSLTTQVFDFRVGGEWAYTMHGLDGTDYPNRCRYSAIIPEMGFRYSQSGGRAGDMTGFEGEVRLEPVQDLTRVVIELHFASAADRDRVVRDYGALEGGHQTLARLAALVET